MITEKTQIWTTSAIWTTIMDYLLNYWGRGDWDIKTENKNEVLNFMSNPFLYFSR